jgi:hypothetical protein
MVRVHAVLPAVLVASLVLPMQSAAQRQATPSSISVRPLIEGSIAGLLLGFAHVAPRNEAWGISDESALVVSIMTGIATAYGVQISSAGFDPDEPRRPRLRIALGASNSTKLDHEFALRMPTGRRFDTQVAINLSSDSWEKNVYEERCVLYLGCFMGTFLEDARYDQSAAATMGVVIGLQGSPSRSPTLTFALGPAVTHTERFDRSRTDRGGVLGEITLGVDSPGRSRWTIAAGIRGVSSATERVAAHARVGRAFGY